MPPAMKQARSHSQERTRRVNRSTCTTVTSAAADAIVYAGIDVSADRLDIARHDQTHVHSLPNDSEGIARAVELLAAWRPQRIAVESTGKLERPLMAALLDARLNVCHVNPQRVRHFGLGMGWIARTDAIDARLLARFAEKAGPRLASPRPAQQQELAELLGCRRQLIDARTAHANQLKRTFSSRARNSLEAVLRTLQKQIDQLDEQIAQLIDSDEDMRHLDRILRSVAGVGMVLSATLIAQLGELGQLDHKPLVALVGLAPFNRDSGRSRGTGGIQGGRKAVRNVLYVCTVAAVRCNAVIRAKYHQLLAAGKPAKVALIACARKLLRILNALVRDNTPWNPQTPNNT